MTVLRCPYCGGLHQHNVKGEHRVFSRSVLRRCPATRRRYVLHARRPRFVARSLA